MTWKIIQGDVRDKLAELPEKSVQCVVTSPPYWGLRDYGVDGQLGLEKTPEEYVSKMVEVFREVKRVLRDDGTLWLNLGDSYSGNCSRTSTGRAGLGNPREGVFTKKGKGIKPKDLVGIPWMVAFALRDDGWYLRSDIIWAKPNSMPESVTDRPTKSHEYIFLLTKKQKYFYDAEAVKEPKAESSIERYNHPRFGSNNKAKNRKDSPYAVAGGDYSENEKRETGRNKRTVWTVSTQPYPEAHFATFPPKLIEPCILAGTSPKACEICGSPWERVVEKKRINRQTGKEVLGGWGDGGDPANQHKGGFNSIRPETHTKTLGWQPTCTCKNSGKGRCIVLDPFAGSGTTLWVAEQHGRDSIGIELNPEYCNLICKRMDKMQQTIFSLGVSE